MMARYTCQQTDSCTNSCLYLVVVNSIYETLSHTTGFLYYYVFIAVESDKTEHRIQINDNEDDDVFHSILLLRIMHYIDTPPVNALGYLFETHAHCTGHLAINCSVSLAIRCQMKCLPKGGTPTNTCIAPVQVDDTER